MPHEAAVSKCVESSASKARHAVPGQVCFEVVGYLLEELRDADNLNTFNKDMQDANIFVGSLIFIEELADKVLQPVCRADSSGD